jgi:hypothetical protein
MNIVITFVGESSISAEVLGADELGFYTSGESFEATLAALGRRMDAARTANRKETSLTVAVA